MGEQQYAESNNGVYHLEVRKNRFGYVVESWDDAVAVERITINGGYIGTSDGFEIECRDYDLNDGVMNLVMGENDG